MVEVLGILLAVVLLGLGWLAWRLVATVRARLFGGGSGGGRPPRGGRLGVARARLQAADTRSAELVAEVERLRLQLRLVKRERDTARAALDAIPRRTQRGTATWRAAVGDSRFDRAKRAFALHFHPDRPGIPARERNVRAAMFREFWSELKEIERG